MMLCCAYLFEFMTPRSMPMLSQGGPFPDMTLATRSLDENLRDGAMTSTKR
jgi:hypothetical protein